MKERKPMGFLVRLIPPTGAGPADLRAYVEDAVASWKGSYNPEDPIFDLDGDTVRASVRSLTVNKIEKVEQLKEQINRLTVERDQLQRRLLDCLGRERETPVSPEEGESDHRARKVRVS